MATFTKGKSIIDYFSEPSPIWERSASQLAAEASSAAEFGLVTPLAITSPFTQTGGLLSKILGKTVTTATPTAAAATPTITAGKVVTKSVTKGATKTGTILGTILAGAAGGIAGYFLSGGGGQDQTQDVTQTAAPQTTAPQDTTAITDQQTLNYTYAPVTTTTKTYTYNTTNLMMDVSQSGSGLLYLTQTPSTSASPTIAIEPTSAPSISTDLQTALTPIQAQLQELLSAQSQEATQETSPLLIIALLAGAYFFLKGEGKSGS